MESPKAHAAKHNHESFNLLEADLSPRLKNYLGADASWQD
jgi:hypothetical protein